MNNILEELEALHQRIADRNEQDIPGHYLDRIAITPIANQFSLDYYGNSFEESYLDLLKTISQPQIAPHVQSLILRGPDEGANGTHNWDITPLVETSAVFLNLESFIVQLNQAGDHNRSIIGTVYEEDGVIASLLEKAPKLRQLVVPSAPNKNFFEVGQHPLRFLSVDAGYDTQDFISNLSQSNCFPDLYCLEWGEYNETYMEDYLEKCTPINDYHKLFLSNSFKNIARFVWRNPVCTDEEIKDLKKLKSDIQLLVVRFSDQYV